MKYGTFSLGVNFQMILYLLKMGNIDFTIICFCWRNSFRLSKCKCSCKTALLTVFFFNLHDFNFIILLMSVTCTIQQLFLVFSTAAERRFIHPIYCLAKNFYHSSKDAAQSPSVDAPLIRRSVRSLTAALFCLNNWSASV